MINKRKVAGAVLAAVLSTAGLVACSSDSSSSSSGGSASASGPVTLTVWTSQEDQTDDNAWLQTMEAKFKEANPDLDVTFKNSVVSYADAGTTVNQDPSAAADVYYYANDQLGSLLDAGAVGQLSDSGMAQLKEQDSATMADSVKGTDGESYGLPVEPNTWFMYYNKSKLSAEDVKSFDTMLSKAKVSFPLSNSWYLPAFYAGAGATFFGSDGLDESAGIDLGSKAADVTKYLVDVSKNPNFVNDADGSGMGGLANGAVDVVFSGAWDSKAAQEALGANYGVAALPTFKLDGQDVQMKAFSGSKAIGYNPNTSNPQVAAQFAEFLASTDSQKIHFQKTGVIPADQTLADDPEISADPVATALFEVVGSDSILQPTFNAMSDFWDPAENFGKAITNGEVTADNAADKTAAWASSYK